MYCGFVIQYEVTAGERVAETMFSGPFSTIEETRKKYEDLKLLFPTVKNPFICRLVYNPSKPEYQ
jgi:hypothetical protein